MPNPLFTIKQTVAMIELLTQGSSHRQLGYIFANHPEAILAHLDCAQLIGFRYWESDRIIDGEKI